MDRAVSKRKVLYVSYDGLTDPLGQSQILPYVIGLSKEQYAFTIISFEKPDRLEKGALHINSLCLQHDIEWIPLPYTKFPPVLSTLKDLRRLKREGEKLLSNGEFRIVHCRSYITALAGLWFKKAYGLKMIFDMRGFWADERVDGGLWNLKNPLYRSIYKYFKQKELEFINNSDYTVSLTYHAKDEILSWSGINKDKVNIQVIPCCVDLKLFTQENVDKKKIEAKKQSLNIRANNWVICYIGSIGTWYMLDEMLDFFKEVLTVLPNAIFLFVTKESATEILNAATQKGIPVEKMRVVASERDEMPYYIACAQYSIFFIKPAYSKKASSPTKQGEIMAMGIPAICNEGVGDTSYVVNKYDSGIIIKDFSTQAYKEAISFIRTKAFNTKSIYNGATDFYSLQNGIAKYKTVYEAIIT